MHAVYTHRWTVILLTIESFPHYSVLGAGCQVEQGDSDPLSDRNWCPVVICDGPQFRPMGFVTIRVLSDEQLFHCRRWYRLLISYTIAIICEIIMKVSWPISFNCLGTLLHFYKDLRKRYKRYTISDIHKIINGSRAYFFCDTPKNVCVNLGWFFLRMTSSPEYNALQSTISHDTAFYFLFLITQ